MYSLPPHPGTISSCFWGFCQWLQGLLQAPDGSSGRDFSGPAGTVLVRKWDKVTGEESTSGLYSILGK